MKYIALAFGLVSYVLGAASVAEHLAGGAFVMGIFAGMFGAIALLYDKEKPARKKKKIVGTNTSD